MSEPLPSAPRRAWHAVRAGLEAVVGRRALDRALDAFGFFRLRSLMLAKPTAVKGGLTLLARPDDMKILGEVFEEEVYGAVAIKEDDVVVDAGAHIGSFSVWASRKCPKGRVVAFEPAPINLDLLRRNLARTGSKNVTVVPSGLGAVPGTMRLHWLGDFSMYTMDPTRGDSASFDVPVDTVDAALQRLGVREVGVLKIDVERHEAEVLRGASKTLPRTREVVAEVSKDAGLPEAVRSLLEAAGLPWNVVWEAEGALVVHARRPT